MLITVILMQRCTRYPGPPKARQAGEGTAGKRGTQTGGGTFLSVPGGMLVKNIIKGII